MRRAGLIVLFVLALVAAACGDDEPAATSAATAATTAESTGATTAESTTATTAAPTTTAAPAEPARLIIGIGAEPGTVDPLFLNGDQAINAILEVIEPLTTIYTPGGMVAPSLATEWSANADGTSWTFTLQQGIKFHDGTDFNADAVKFNLDRVRDPDVGSANVQGLGLIDEVVVIDEFTVRFDLSQPLGYFPSVIASTAAGIISPASLTGDAYLQLTHLVGTGPYKFVEYVNAVHVLLEKNEDYWGDKPAYDELEFRIIPEPTGREAALRAGDVDIIVQPPPADLVALGDDPNLTATTAESRRFMFLSINTQTPQQPLLLDKRVRQALNYAIDKQALIDTVLFGLGNPVDSPVPPVLPGYCSVGTYDYDPDKARALLAEAGAEGMTIQMQSPTGRYLQDFQVSTAIAGYLRDVGIDVVGPTTADFPTYIGTLLKVPAEAEHDLSFLGIAAIYPETGAHMGYFITSRIPPGGLNTSFFTNQAVDDKVFEADGVPDRDAANALYCEAQNTIWDEAPWIFLWTQASSWVHSNDVGSVVLLPNEMVHWSSAQPAS